MDQRVQGPAASTTPVSLWSAKDIQAAIGGQWIGGDPSHLVVTGISYTRSELRPGDLYFARDPQNWGNKEYADDNDRLRKIFELGASCAVVSRRPKWIPSDKPVLLVEDSRKALDELGRAARNRLENTTVICITGSVGKSSTKEILGELLAPSGLTKISPANRNHGPGVPLSLGITPPESDYGVYEFAVDLPRVTLRKAKIARPHVTVITNIHEAHLNHYGSTEKVSDQKSLLFEVMEPGGAVVLNRDSPFFGSQKARAMACGIKRIYSFGAHSASTVRLVSADCNLEGSDVSVVIDGKNVQFQLPLPGLHVVHNCLAALATVLAVGADIDAAMARIGSLQRFNLPQRLEERTIELGDGQLLLIDDTYSANPASLRAGLQMLRLRQPRSGGRKIAILGELKDLGLNPEHIHSGLASAVDAAGFELLFTFGAGMITLRDALARTIPGLHSDDPNALARALAETLHANDIVYVKGTHHDEDVLEFLMASIASPRVDGKSGPTYVSPHDPTTTYAGPTEPVVIAPKNENQLEILLLGDTAFGENYQAALQESKGRNILVDKGYDYPLAKMRGALVAADLVIANLETPLTDLRSSPFSGVKSYVHWGDVAKTPMHLLKHNISAVALANNHTFDYGKDGFDQTLRVLSDSGVRHFGAGRNREAAARPFIATAWQGARQFTLAVISAYEHSASVEASYGCYAGVSRGGLCPLDAETIKKSIDQTRERYPAAFIVVFPHWGPNYEWRTKRQGRLAEDIMAAGADLIVGHGAHTLQEIERHPRGWVVYSIGNFMFNSPGRYAQKGALPFSLVGKLVISRGEAELAKSLRLFPILTDNKQSGYQTAFADPDQFAKVVESLEEHCPAMFRHGSRIGREDDRPFIELPL